MDNRVQIAGLISSVLLLVFVLELVRRRKLREEYAWLWLITAIGYFILLVFPDLFIWFSNLIGASRPISALTFLGIFFLALICIQFSVRLSNITDRNKQLAQHIAIIDSELQELAANLKIEKSTMVNADNHKPDKLK